MKDDLLLELLSVFKRKDFLFLYDLAQSSLWKLNEKDCQFLNKLADNPHRYKQLYEAEKAVDSFSQRKGKIIELIEDYILLLKNRENQTNRNLQLAHFYNERRLVKNYEQKIKKTKKNITDRPLDKDTALFNFRYHEILATNSRISRKPMNELEEMNKALLSFFSENNLRILSEIHAQKGIINHNYQIDDFSKLLLPKVNTLVQGIYYNIYQMWKSSNTKENYDFLKEIIKTEPSSISIELLKTIYTHLMNYAIRHINIANSGYASEYIFYINSLIDQNLFLERKRLDYGRYRNTIIAYLIKSPKDFNQVYEFIDSYKNNVDYPHAMDIVKINSIYVSLFEKKYKEAHEELHALTDKNLDLHHKIMFKKLDLQFMLMLKSNRDTLSKKITNFKTFLYKQNQLKGGKKLKVSLNFLACINLIIDQNLDLKTLNTFDLALTDKIWFLTKKIEESQTLS